MLTNDERREIAARLRDFDSLRPTFKDSVLCGFLETLDVGYLDWEGVCGRLADLIEPEPENATHMYRDEHGTWHCKSCENGGDNITALSTKVAFEGIHVCPQLFGIKYVLSVTG